MEGNYKERKWVQVKGTGTSAGLSMETVRKPRGSIELSEFSGWRTSCIPALSSRAATSCTQLLSTWNMATTTNLNFTLYSVDLNWNSCIWLGAPTTDSRRLLSRRVHMSKYSSDRWSRTEGGTPFCNRQNSPQLRLCRSRRLCQNDSTLSLQLKAAIHNMWMKESMPVFQ